MTDVQLQPASGAAATPPYMPALGEFGLRVFPRTLDTNGNRVGTFNDSTTPNAEQAQSLLDDAAAVVEAELGPTVPADAIAMARFAVIARAAMALERTYFPEDTNAGDSAYAAWQQEFAAALASAKSQMFDDQPNQQRMASVPMGTLVRPGVPGTTWIDPWNNDLLA